MTLADVASAALDSSGLKRTTAPMAFTRGALAGLSAALMAVSAVAQTPATPPAEPTATAAPPASLERAAPANPVAGTVTPTPTGVAESIAVVVNDEPISTYDVRQRMLLLFTLTGTQPSQANLSQYQQEAVRSLIEERLERQELTRQGTERHLPLIVEDAVVDQEVASLAQESHMTLEQFAQSLQVRGLTLNELREYRRVQISWLAFVRAYFRTRVAISPGQVQAQLARLNAAQSRPQYQISEIFIDAARVGGQQEAIGGAQQLAAQLGQGAPFQAVARQFSNASTAARGGDAGWVSAADLDPAVLATVEQMRPGQLSGPIPVSDGVYLVALRDRRSGAGVMVVHLKQAAIRLNADAPADQIAAARQRLTELRPRVNGCDGLEAAARGVEGVIVGDLGTVEESGLDERFSTAAATLQPGQVSDVIQTPVGLHLIVLCERRQQAASLPSATEIENRLRADAYEQYARRYLRDLQNSAIIEFR